MTDVAAAQEVAPEQGSGDATVDDWKAALPEELQRDPSIAHIKDVPNLAQSYVNGQRMIGAEKLAIPGKFGTDEEWNQVYDKLGRPETPEGYELEMNNVPEGLESNPELVGWFQQTAHEVGLTPSQAQKLADKYNEMAGQAENTPSQQQAEAQALEEEGIRELQREYGKAFDNKIGIGRAVLSQYGGDELLDLRLEDGRSLGSHPGLVRMVVNIGDYMGKNLGEDSIAGLVPKSDGAITPNDAQKEIDKLTVMGGPYWDSKHPNHSGAVAEVLRLREFTTVEEPAE